MTITRKLNLDEYLNTGSTNIKNCTLAAQEQNLLINCNFEGVKN